MQVVVLADTHGPRFWKRCPAGLVPELRRCDLLLHAGDVCVASVLDELAAYAPVQVVMGNNDGAEVAQWGARPEASLDLEGLSVSMIHDSGPKNGRLKRMGQRFPAADLVVFGHSHIPLTKADGSLRIFNPGSPTDKRRQPYPTFGRLRVEDGTLTDLEIVELR